MQLTIYQLLGIFTFILVLAICFVSCDTTKKMEKEDLTLIVLLQKKETGDYLQKTYSDYQPTNIKRSNRTLNQYRVQFNCTAAETKTLLQKLENDPQVVKFSNSQKASTKQ